MLGKCGLVVGCLFVAQAGFASYDLSLIPQLSNHKINRFDPVTGVNLGSFNVANPENLTLDQSHSRVFVSHSASTRIRSYDYNLGNYLDTYELSALPIQSVYHAGSNSLFCVTTTGVVKRLNLTNGAITDITGIAGITYKTIALTGDVLIAAGTNSSNAINTLSLNATTLAMTDNFNIGVTVAASSRLGKSIIMNRGTFLNVVIPFVSSSGTVGAFFGSTSLTGFVNSGFTQLPTGFNSFTVPSAMPGHNGYFLLGLDSASTTTMRVQGYSFAADMTSVATSTGYVFVDSNFGAVNIVAPEPASLLALGLGMLVLARRKSAPS